MDGVQEKAARGTGVGEEGPGGAGGDAGRRAGLRGKQDAREKQAVRRLSETKRHCQGRQGEEEKEEKASRWEHMDCLNHKCRLTVTDTVTATSMPWIDAWGQRGAHGSAPCISSLIRQHKPRPKATVSEARPPKADKPTRAP